MTESSCRLGFWVGLAALAAGCGGTITTDSDAEDAGSTSVSTSDAGAQGGSAAEGDGGTSRGGGDSSGGTAMGGGGTGGGGTGGSGTGGSGAGGSGTGGSGMGGGGMGGGGMGGGGTDGGGTGGGGTGGGGTGGSGTGGGGTGGIAGDAGTAGAGGVVECDPVVAVPGTQVVYELARAQAATSATLDFFDFPWPELRRNPTELAGFPNPAAAVGCPVSSSDPIIRLLVSAIDPVEYRQYLTSMAAQFLHGFATSAHIVMRFDHPIDASRLPTPQQSLDPATSTVLLVNLDTVAPSRGRLVPTATRVLNNSLYAHPNTLSILPYPGFALMPGRYYAAVVKRSLADATGASLGSHAAFEALKATGDCAPNANYSGAFDLLESELSLPRGEIAMMTVFHGEFPEPHVAQISAVDAMSDPATLANLTVTQSTLDAEGGYYAVSGTFENLNLQQGTPPYLPPISVALDGSVTVTFEPNSTEGALLLGPLPLAPGGTDTAQPRTELLEFRLAIPASLVSDPSALASLPVVIYATGTGGTIDTPFLSGVASALAQRGVATFSTTPVMHGARAHSENIDPTLRSNLQLADLIGGTNYEASLDATVESGDLFFNPLNLMAARGNSSQAAVDYAWQARILSSVTLRVDLGGSAATVGFAPAKIGFFGHSQGAATGPLLGSSSHVSAQVLSAPSGHLITNLLGKTMPADSLDIALMLSYLTCDSPDEPLDVHHPFLNVLQHWFAEVDAVSYAPHLTVEPPLEGKHVFVLAGTEDHYVSPLSHDAVISAARLFEVAPELVPVVGQELLGIMLPGAGYDQAYASLSGNLDGSVTAAFRQYHNATCSDDHFVATCDSQAIADWLRFFETWSAGTPVVP